MRVGTRFLISGGLLLLAACTRTVVVQGPPPSRQPVGSRPPPRTSLGPDAPAPPPPVVVRTNEVLIPPGHLPRPGECRLWIPGRAPGRQPQPRSRACAGIEALAPAGSWIVYRRADDERLIYIRLIDERRPSIVIRNRIFDGNTWELLREEDVRDDRRGDDRQGRDQNGRPRERPGNDPPPVVQPPAVQPPGNRPPEIKPPEVRPPEQRPPLPPREIIPPVQPPPPAVQPRDTQPPPQRRDTQPAPPVQPPPVQPPPPTVPNVTLSIPPGHLPELGECRVWIPRLPPGQQPKPKSRTCNGILGVAPAGSWILYRPSEDEHVVHVRLIDERRAGVVIRVRIFDIDSKRLVREENP